MERLKHTEFDFSLMVEASPSAIVLIDSQGSIIYINKLAEKLFQYNRKELIGKKLEVLIPEKFRKHHPSYRDLFISHPQTRPMGEGRDLNALKKDGSAFPAEIGLNPIKTTGEIFVLASVIDITKRRELEKAVQAKSKELEEQYQKLQQSEEKLKELNATKDKFFSIVAHDLKNPFNSILGFTQLLMESYDSFDEDERKDFISNINASSETTYKLLENLLTWAKTQQEGTIINKERLILLDSVQKSVEPYLPVAEKKRIQIKTTIEEGQQVFVDSDMLNMVISNIVSNAIKFTPEEGSIHINSLSNKSGRVQLLIKDTGVGMNPTQLSKLFKIEENDNSTLGTNNELGTGLGLILCKEFIEKNDGYIEVESEKGKGSTFIITLPT